MAKLREVVLAFVIFIFNLVNYSHQSFGIVSSPNRDDTLLPQAHGKDLVESVLRKISKSGIFPPDYSFLICIALVQTRFGDDANTFRSHYYGGIWQVDEHIYRATLSSSLSHIHTKIRNKFGIQWKSTSWFDLLKPLYSGLAAAIYFESLGNPIPQRIPLQADYWKRHYCPSCDKQKFIRESEELRNKTICRGKMDLCIVLDSSGSIKSENYQTALDFVASVINSFTLDHTRIGMLIYSNNVEDIFEINNNLNIQQMATRARNAPYHNGGTATDKGIARAVEMFQNLGSTTEVVPKIMLVLTDGVSNNRTQTLLAVARSQATGIKSISVGIGSSLSEEELTAIALNDPQAKFKLTDFSSLQDFLYTITSVTCEIHQKPEMNSTNNDTLVEGERRTYQIPLPREGVTITVDTTNGYAKGYWSKTEEVPTEAVHDGEIYGNDQIFIEGGAGTNVVYVTMEGEEATNDYTLAASRGDNIIWDAIRDV